MRRRSYPKGRYYSYIMRQLGGTDQMNFVYKSNLEGMKSDTYRYKEFKDVEMNEEEWEFSLEWALFDSDFEQN